MQLSIFFFVYFLKFAFASCGLKDGFYEAISRTNFREEMVLRVLTNTTIATLLPFFPLGTHLSQNDSQIPQDLLAIDKELASKKCLRNVSKCMEKDKKYEVPLHHLTKNLFKNEPILDFSTVEGVSKNCKEQTLLYQQELKKYKLWALKMYDASAKLPSGILSGNINQLGDFDLCLSSRSKNEEIIGKYCLAGLQIEIPSNPYLSAIHRLIHSNYHFKSNLDDPGHRVPRFSSINWAFCVPNSCTSQDVQLAYSKLINNFLNGTDLKYKVQVDADMCQTSKNPLPKSTIFVGGLFMSLIIWTIISTLYDLYSLEKSDLMTAFSLRKNWRSLLKTDRSSNDVNAVHGIRFLNAAMLYFSHKSMAIFFTPFVNRTQMTEIVGKPWTVIGRAASLYTDPFIMMSGALTAYSLIGKLQKGNGFNFGKEVISRLFRIVPSLGALILFCTFILPFVNSGPMWNLVVSHHAENCKKYWWRNLLFIHNYFGFKDMCLTHTHHVGIDTQLFFASPLLILLVWKWKKRGLSIILSLAVISTAMRYYTTYSRQLSNYIHYGTSIQQLFNTADYMYTLPVYRATVYIMGIALGFALKNCKTLQLSKSQKTIGNAVALFSFSVSFFGPAFMSDINYVYNPVHAAWYAAFSPIFWCLSFAWIIFLAHTGHKGFMARMFSWPGFLVTTRVSYAFYLTQFPAFFYNIGTARASKVYGFFTEQFNIPEALWIIVLSVLLTLLVELPFQNLRNVMFKQPKRVKTS